MGCIAGQDEPPSSPLWDGGTIEQGPPLDFGCFAAAGKRGERYVSSRE